MCTKGILRVITPVRERPSPLSIIAYNKKKVRAGCGYGFLSIFVAAMMIQHVSSAAAGTPLAFPGAVGFGADASGGRGGKIYTVTNLKNSGAGSLRQAVSRPHRIVNFRVSGYIRLKSPLSIASDITINGQTAPSMGVATRGYEVSLSGSHNIIVRYMRFRQGLTPGQKHKSAVAIYKGRDIILDHVDIQFGRWDDLDMNKSHNITIQNSIIGPGIAPQRFGSLCQSDDVTFYHDLWINNHSRNPKAKGRIQFINNVVYNWGVGGFLEGMYSRGKSWDSVVGNFFIKGPDTGSRPAFGGGNANAQVYARGNLLGYQRDGKCVVIPLTKRNLGPVTVRHRPFAGFPWKIQSASAALKYVTAHAGCSLHRDAVDNRLITDLESLGRRGHTIDRPADMGGWGKLQ